VVHTEKVLRLSLDLPIVIEVVETRKPSKQFSRLDEMIGGGLIPWSARGSSCTGRERATKRAGGAPDRRAEARELSHLQSLLVLF